MTKLGFRPYLFSVEDANSFPAWGRAPGCTNPLKIKALKARFHLGFLDKQTKADDEMRLQRDDFLQKSWGVAPG
jgi:hypothetical protein